MMADVVEDSAVRTGRRSEGLFFSSMAFIAKALSGAGTLIAGQILAVIGFPDHATPSTIDPAIVMDLGIIYVPVIAGFYGVGILCLSRYRITKEQHEDNLRRLNEGVDAASAPIAAGMPAVEIAAREEIADTLAPVVPRPAE
jgi:Na+/melibiose symporter-like transporter